VTARATVGAEACVTVKDRAGVEPTRRCCVAAVGGHHVRITARGELGGASAQVVAGSVMVHSVVVPLVTVTVPVGVMPEGVGVTVAVKTWVVSLP